MPVPSAPQMSDSDALRRHWWKPTLWAAMGGMTLSVTLYSEIPLLRLATEQAHLRPIVWLIVPHILGGLIALASGPLQFSSRLRRNYPKFHRVLGRVYVCSVFMGAPLGIVLTGYNHNPQPIYFAVANSVQGGTWMIATAAAFLAARTRHFRQHREWMIRSYAVTFTFVASRVPRPIPAWNRIGRPGAAMIIVIITFLAILIPDIALTWQELTRRRV